MRRQVRGKCLLPSVVAVFALIGCNDNDNNPAAGSLTLACSASPTSGTAPLQVGFTVVTTGATGPFTIAVNFGDGTTATGSSVGHLYTTPGNYTAQFSASGSGGSSGQCSASIAVQAPPPGPVGPVGNQPPDAVFKTNPASVGGTISGTAPLEVLFNMCPTSDPDHDTLFFTMDFQLDGILDVHGTTGADCRRAFTYPLGTTRARICVSDTDGGAALHPAQCETYTIDATP
jgi:hypothetical protein